MDESRPAASKRKHLSGAEKRKRKKEREYQAALAALPEPKATSVPEAPEELSQPPRGPGEVRGAEKYAALGQQVPGGVLRPRPPVVVRPEDEHAGTSQQVTVGIAHRPTKASRPQIWLPRRLPVGRIAAHERR